MTTRREFTTDQALFAAVRSEYPAARVKLDRDWNEFKVTVPGAAVELIDKAHDAADQMAARGEVFAAVARLCAPAPKTPGRRFTLRTRDQIARELESNVAAYVSAPHDAKSRRALLAIQLDALTLAAVGVRT